MRNLSTTLNRRQVVCGVIAFSAMASQNICAARNDRLGVLNDVFIPENDYPYFDYVPGDAMDPHRSNACD